MNVGLPHSIAAASPHNIASPHHTEAACLSAPPILLGECGFFNTLVVRVLYSSIFWQFWVLFVLRSSCNSFVWGSAECLPTPLSWLEVPPCVFTSSFLYVAVFWVQIFPFYKNTIILDRAHLKPHINFIICKDCISQWGSYSTTFGGTPFNPQQGSSVLLTQICHPNSKKNMESDFLKNLF